MPKDTGKENSRTRYQVQAQAEVQKLATHLMVDNRGEEAREIEITFSTADQKDVSKRAEMIDKVLRQTPNLTKLTLDFSGWLYKPSDCIGEALLETMCKLTKLEHFENHQTAGTRIDFGLYELRKLVSSWPNLRTLYLAGDTQGSQKAEDIPSATCALESVTLERFFSRYESLAPIFAGSANSMKSLEIWAMGAGELDTILRPVIPSIEDITFGGGHYPTSSFLKDELSKAPNLHTLRFCGAFTDNRVRLTFSEVLKNDDAYPALRYLEYPAQEGTYKTGRGRNVRVHEYENPGQEELLEVCRKRNIRANVGRELKYSVEGAGRRAGFAALARRGR